MLQELRAILLVVSLLLAPPASVLVHLIMVGFLMVIILWGLSMWLRRGAIVPLRFPLWFSILVIKALPFILLHVVDGITM